MNFESNSLPPKIRFGSRKSDLALRQTRAVVEQFRSHAMECKCEIVEMSTRGDRTLDKPLPEIGGKGLFTEELDRAILEGQIDLAIHSLKDLPTQAPEMMTIFPVLEREDPSDALISQNGQKISDLPTGSTVGTSSPRRQAQILCLRPDLNVQPIRGNIQTRLRKMREGEFDAIVLATAGLKRAGLADQIVEKFCPEQMLPAPAQGMIAATLRADNESLLKLLGMIADPASSACVQAERFLLAFLGGGCSMPISALATCQHDGQLFLTGRVNAADGSDSLTESIAGNMKDAEKLARELSDSLFAKGAERMLQSIGVPPGSSTSVPSNSPLQNVRVAVTRGGDQNSDIVKELIEYGASVITVPLIRFEPINQPDISEQLLAYLRTCQWLVFTSLNGAKYFFQLFPVSNIPEDIKIGCVGAKTENQVRQHGLKVDFLPSKFNARTFAQELPLEPESLVLLPSPKESREELPDILTERGAKVIRFPVYETLPVPLEREDIESLTSDLDVITFASPSAIKSYLQQVSEPQNQLGKTLVACIGPTTRAYAESKGISVDIMPEEYSMSALATDLVRYFTR